MARRKKKSNNTVSFDDVGKSFADGQEYLVKIQEIELEDGESAQYYSLKLEGTGEFEGSIMYHNASLATNALWKTRDIFEAFLGEVPEGEFDPADYLDEFKGKMAMCSTFKDTYNGNTRIKPEDFWAAEGTEMEGEEGEAIDLDEMDDADIKKIGKAMKIKSKRASTIRKELEDADADELEEVLIDLGLIETEGGEEEEEEDEDDEDGDELDLDELDDDDIKALAKAAGIKGSRVSTLKKKLAELDENDLAEAAEEAGIGEGSSGGGDVTAEAISEMDQDELEALIEEHDLEIKNWKKLKTLRKQRTAVIDAAEEAGILEDD